MTVQNGGTVIQGGSTVVNTTGLFIGADPATVGNLTVLGAGSEFDNTGSFVIGGNGSAQPGGFGSLQIQSGGTITTALGSGQTIAADIAAQSGSDGSSATVTGPNSTWNVNGSLIVGDAAVGGLSITNGGTVNAGAITLGGQAGGLGNLTLNGSTSALAATGDITVGAGANGNLLVDGGAFLSGQTLNVGTNPNVTGLVNLQGPDFVSLSGLVVGGNGGAGVLVEGGGVFLLVNGPEVINTGGVLVTAGDPVNNFQSGTINAPQTVSANTVNNYFTVLFNNSTITVDNGAPLFEIAPTIDVNTTTFGDWLIGSNGGGASAGTLVLDAGTISAHELINFSTAAAGTLDIANVGSNGSFVGFDAIIDNFASGFSQIYLQPIVTTTTVIAGQTVVTSATQGTIDPIGSATLTATGGSVVANGTTVAFHDLLLFGGANETGTVLGTLAVADTITGADLSWLETVNSQGGLGALPCFAAGTRIRTADGEVAVEDLREGDLLATVVGGGLAPVVWIGHRHVDCARHPEPRKVWPVRIRAGAFGPGLPERELWVSPDHALYFDGVLIPVRYLVDGAAVAQVAVDQVTYYHVELPKHDVVLAEGLAAESFLDTGGRRMFANGGGPLVLHPDFATRQWEAEGCAPLAIAGAELAEARRKIRTAAQVAA